MKKSKLFIVMSVILLSASLVFAGGSAEDESKIVIEYWSSWNATEAQAYVMEAAAEEYMDLHPNVEINFTFNGRDNRFLVPSAIQAGTKITVMDAAADNIAAHWSDYICSLEEYYDEVYPTTDGKKFSEVLLPSMVKLSADLFDGKRSFIPFIPQAFMIFCNKGLLEECGITEYPTTWEELMEVCETIKQAGYIPVTSDSAYNTAWFGYYIMRLVGHDRALELMSNQSAWDAPEVLEAAKAIEYMATQGYFDPQIASNQYPTGQQNMVINENIAMYINGTWLPNELYNSTPEDFVWGQFAFPTVPNGVDDQSAGCYSTYGMAINKDATPEEKQAAFEFGVLLTTKYDQDFADEAHIVPVNIDSEWPEELSEAKEIVMNYTTRYLGQPLVVDTSSYQIVLDACRQLMGGMITAEEFITMAKNF